jgi:hypothetical protein
MNLIDDIKIPKCHIKVENWLGSCKEGIIYTIKDYFYRVHKIIKVGKEYDDDITAGQVTITSVVPRTGPHTTILNKITIF